MCEALPGRRCSNDAFAAYNTAKRRYETLPADTRGLERANAAIDYQLAAADYAATFPKQNPGLHAAATRLRDEQVALMPTKPAVNEPGHKEYERLAKARHRLASVTTAAYDAERAGTAKYETTQALFESAVFEVAQAEGAFRKVAWTHYDVTTPAQDELVAAMDSGDDARIRDAKALFYLTQHHTWPQDATERVRASHSMNDYKEIDAAYAERDLAHGALARVPGLIERTYPHSTLTREQPGQTMQPATWVGRGRDVDPCDTAQVRYLCEGGSSGVKWHNEARTIVVRRPNQATMNRLWAYGFHTESAADPNVILVARAPVVSERSQSPALRAAV